MAAAGAVTGVDPICADQPEFEAASQAGAGDGRRRRHGRLERGRGVHRGPQVDHDRRPTLPWQLVLADEQFLGSGRGFPMHPAQVVAHDVGTQGMELVAAGPERRLGHHAAARIGAPGVGKGGDALDAGVDGDGVLAGHLNGPAGQAEWIGAYQLQGADLEQSAPFGGNAVGGRAALAATERRHPEAGPPAAVVERVARGEYRGASNAKIPDVEVDAARRSGVDPSGNDAPDGLDVDRAVGDQGHAGGREDEGDEPE